MLSLQLTKMCNILNMCAFLLILLFAIFFYIPMGSVPTSVPTNNVFLIDCWKIDYTFQEDIHFPISINKFF